MECGANDLACHVLTWLTENELAVSGLAELLARFGENASGFQKEVAQFVKDYGQALVGLFGMSFGIWRWWRYRERILHKRLAEYIATKDARLGATRIQALEAIQRPAPGQSFEAPLFIDRQLKSVLRENRWDNSVMALSIETSADWQLSQAIECITGKLQTAEREANSLRRELSTAHGLRGAIAASKPQPQQLPVALSHIRSALAVPGHENDLQIKELEAHQLRKLGYFTAARRVYGKIIKVANTAASARENDIFNARAKRYLAEMESESRPKNAYQMMTADLADQRHSPGALALLEECQPFSAWEFVEKGDMHYFTAYLAHRLTFPAAPLTHLNEAVVAYESALLHVPKTRWPLGRAPSRLEKLIEDRQQRVRDAVQNKVYDTAWLPSSQQPQQPPSTISSRRSG